MDKYKNKYRIESNRMPGWDYSRNGYYFVTFIIQNFECLLGKIENDKMIFSDFGRIANHEWLESFKIRKELFLDEYQIMPNHVHAIIILKNKNRLDNRVGPGVGDVGDVGDVETHGRASLHADPADPAKQFKRKPKSISSFMAGYKSSVTTKIDDFIDLHNLPFEKYNKTNRFWQINYHDHIIRDQKEYWRIKKYIQNNPKNWIDDKFYR